VKILIDAQLPPGLKPSLAQAGHEAYHVFKIGLRDAATARVVALRPRPLSAPPSGGLHWTGRVKSASDPTKTTPTTGGEVLQLARSACCSSPALGPDKD
jgi:hypothetical protein